MPQKMPAKTSSCLSTHFGHRHPSSSTVLHISLNKGIRSVVLLPLMQRQHSVVSFTSLTYVISSIVAKVSVLSNLPISGCELKEKYVYNISFVLSLKTIF